jgi:hypothetical protein
MHAVNSPRSRWGELFAVGSGLVLLFLPGLVLLVGFLRAPEPTRTMLGYGTGLVLVLSALVAYQQPSWRRLLGPLAIAPYVVAILWLWEYGGQSEAWYRHLNQAILLLIPLGILAYHTLRKSGAVTFRQVRHLVQSLADRKDWPADLNDCRALPEVQALRAALGDDATPVLALTRHPRVEVRIAALGALEHRAFWHSHEINQVLRILKRAEEPAVRAAAVRTLGFIHDQALIESLSEYLRDPAWEVRQAATRVLLLDTDKRWAWLRPIVRHALADPAFQCDGPLAVAGQVLSPEMIADLTAWSGEKGTLGVRAALTLGAHFGKVLSDRPDPIILQNLKQRLADPQTPASLRLEMAQLLRSTGELDMQIVEQMLDPSHPAPLRLMAADLLLADPKHPGALAALRDIARLPNREIALSTAEVVQRRLGVDLGLARGQPLPPLHTRPAAEVTRRVMTWATQQESAVPSNA